ncbi:MAG: alpha/beta fold hydrolase [Gemmatimonadales bacterium]
MRANVVGEEIEYLLAGDGPPTVVLVNGSGGPIEGWHKVFEPLSGFARVFAYNRPGIGRSAKPSVPQVGSRMVESLRETLRAGGLAPPYLLVGHSLGGLVVNLFARRHPDEVAAVVFLDAATPEDVGVMPKHETWLQRVLGGLLRRIAPPNPNAETEHVSATVEELARAPAFPAVPLVVVTGGKPAMRWATAAEAVAARAAHQRALAGLSPSGKQIVAAKSGHFPQLSEPEVVVSAIRDAASQASGSGSRE